VVRATGDRSTPRCGAVARRGHSASAPGLDRPVHDQCPRVAERGGARARRRPGASPCAVNLDSVESVSVSVLVERLGRLSDARMREICAALEVAVDCSDRP
jgi:mRNA interferase MazF